MTLCDTRETDLDDQTALLVPVVAAANHVVPIPETPTVTRDNYFRPSQTSFAMTRAIDLHSPTNRNLSTASTSGAAVRRIDTGSISKQCQARLDPQLDVREVDLPDSSRYRCGHCGETDASWLFWMRRHLCAACRYLPEFRTICRSQVYRKFGLTYKQVIQGQEEGALEVMFTPNPRNTGRNAGHDNGSRWMYLYWETQIEGYAQYLTTITSKNRSP